MVIVPDFRMKDLWFEALKKCHCICKDRHLEFKVLHWLCNVSGFEREYVVGWWQTKLN